MSPMPRLPMRPNVAASRLGAFEPPRPRAAAVKAGSPGAPYAGAPGKADRSTLLQVVDGYVDQ